MATTPLGIESQLWSAADTLRGNVDAAEYKHVVLGLLFLKYISDSFDELAAQLKAQGTDPEKLSDPAVQDEFAAESVFWVPPEARWAQLKAKARQPSIGADIDNAMLAIERTNHTLRGVLPRDYGREALDKRRLGELVDLISNIKVGDQEARSKDVLGRVYEYFLGKFAALEGKNAGEFYTPTHIVRLLVEMLEPFKGRVFDPCCGSGGMFVQSERFVQEHGGRLNDISVLGQESNNTTWKLCKMNLAIRGIESNIKWNGEGSFLRDEFPDLKADFIMANPPFGQSKWGGELLRDDVRWRYGVPPEGDADYAWIQHFIHHLSNNGVAGFVMDNGSLSSMQSGEGEIRKSIIEADLVDCIVSLPDKLFYGTGIPVSLWFIARNRANRSGRTLFIDARSVGEMADRTHRVLTDADVKRIADTYHAWRGEKEAGAYEDVKGFCKDATLDEVRGHQHVLTPGRYVGVSDVEDDGEPFEEKMARLGNNLSVLQSEGQALDAEIARIMTVLGNG